MASLSSNDGRQGGTAAVCRRRADGWIRIPVRKRINPCLDSIIALLYCCIQAIADNYSPKGLLANSLIAAWDVGVAFGIFFQHCKGVLCLTFPRASKKRVAWCPSEPYGHALPGALLKEDEMQAALRIGKCSMQCAVGYRIRICFEYQSVPLLE